VRTTTNHEERISKTEHIGVISDVCIQLDPLFKKDYVLLDNSKLAAPFMADAAKNYLEQRGYTVNYTASPFVGSFLPNDEYFRLADERGGEIRTVSPPFYFDDSDSIDETYLNAMLKILNEVHFVMTNNYNPLFTSDTTLRANLETIATYSGQDQIFFMIGNGIKVPTEKTIIKSVTIGLLTALISFGTITYYIYDTSYLNSYIMLLDLHTGEMLWSNSMRLTDYDPDKEAFYKKMWPENLLYHFPYREGVVKEK
jgi:hypothetical protein